MMARSLSDWGVIAEIVSAIAVVLSLIFVGLQIRDNTLATEAAMIADTPAMFGGPFFDYAMTLRAGAGMRESD